MGLGRYCLPLPALWVAVPTIMGRSEAGCSIPPLGECTPASAHTGTGAETSLPSSGTDKRNYILLE